jgi:hypothetical protein
MKHIAHKLWSAADLGKTWGRSNVFWSVICALTTLIAAGLVVAIQTYHFGRFENLWRIEVLLTLSIGFMISGLVLLPKQHEDAKPCKRIGNARRLLTTWYDFVWIVFAFVGVALLASRFGEQYFSELESGSSEITKLHAERVRKLSNQEIQTISALAKEQKGANDDKVLDELAAYATNDIVSIYKEPSYIRGTQKQVFLSNEAINAIDRVKKAEEDTQQSYRSVLLYNRVKRAFVPGEFERLFLAIFLACALGLRLAKVIADIKDASYIQDESNA